MILSYDITVSDIIASIALLTSVAGYLLNQYLASKQLKKALYMSYKNKLEQLQKDMLEDISYHFNGEIDPNIYLWTYRNQQVRDCCNDIIELGGSFDEAKIMSLLSDLRKIFTEEVFQSTSLQEKLDLMEKATTCFKMLLDCYSN